MVTLGERSGSRRGALPRRRTGMHWCQFVSGRGRRRVAVCVGRVLAFLFRSRLPRNKPYFVLRQESKTETEEDLFIGTPSMYRGVSEVRELTYYLFGNERITLTTRFSIYMSSFLTKGRQTGKVSLVLFWCLSVV